MSLLVWLPMTRDLTQQGLSDITVSNVGATLDSNGKLGKCYYFDGNAHYLEFSKSVGDLYSGDFSYAVWLKPMDDTRSVICSEYASSGSSNIAFELSASRQVRLYWNGSPDISSTGCILPKSQWSHIVITRSENEAKFYMNGELKYTYTGTLSNRTSTAKIRLGDDYRGGTGVSYMGYMNDFRLYDHALSPKEVEVLSRGLVCHYPLEGANNTLLPFGYQQLDYIEGAGAAAFDTTYKFNPETDSVKITFKGNDTSNNGMLFGQSAGKYFWLYYYGSNGIRVYANNGSGQQSIAGISSDLNKHTAEYKNKHYYIDGTDKGSLSNTYAEQTTTSWICSYGSTNYGFKGRIYFAQICRSGVPQRTFIPAKRLSDSKIGMYDVSNNVFYPSSTSTAFTAGNVVGTPSTVYDTSGFKNNGETYAYDTTGSIECSSDTARYSLSTFINSANVTDNATGIRYIYGNCELTTPQYLTVAFWCKPIAGYSNHANNGLFALTNNDIGTGAATDYNTAPMHNRDADIDMCTSTNVHKTLSFSGTLNEWHHYAVVYDGRYGKAYIDGVQTATLDMNSNLSLASFKAIVLGYSHAGGVYRKLRAYYSDFRIYATALSAEQVAELYNTAVSVANNGTLMGYELVEV